MKRTERFFCAKIGTTQWERPWDRSGGSGRRDGTNILGNVQWELVNLLRQASRSRKTGKIY